MNFFYRLLNNKKGFTLIEVLVVVAIIGILAALAAPRVIQRINDARIASDEAAMKILNDAIVALHLDNAVNPVDGWTTGAITWAQLKAYLDPATVGMLSGPADADTLGAAGGFTVTGRSDKVMEISVGSDGIHQFTLEDPDEGDD